MAGGKIDILIEPNTRGFSSKLESSLRGGIGVASKVGGLVGVAFGAAGLVQGINKVGAEFRTEMNALGAVTQASAREMDAAAAKARALGNDISLPATSAGDAAAAMTELAKGGFTLQQSMDAAKGTLQLAAAAQIDAASAATIQSQALQAFGLSADYASTASDLLAGAANASSAEIQGIAAGLQQSGTVAHQFGISIEDTSTALAVFANAGIQGSDAGTLLKSALLALTDQGKPAQKAIEELGLTVYDAQGKFVGLPDLFDQLNQAASRMTDEQYQAATATLFGSDAMRLAGIASQQGIEGFNRVRAAVTRQGQAAELAAAKTLGLPGAMEKVQNAAEELGLAVYTKLEGPLSKAFVTAADKLSDLSPALESLSGKAAEGLGQLGGLATSAAQGVAKLPDNLKLAAAAFVALKLAENTKAFSIFRSHVDQAHTSIQGFRETMQLQTAMARANGTEIGRMSAAWGALESHSAAVNRASQAFRDASAESGRFAGTLKGTMAAGASTAKSAVGGLVSALGGPWSLALAGATIAVTAYIDGVQKMKSYTAAYSEIVNSAANSQRELWKALAEGGEGAAIDALIGRMQKLEDARKTALNNDPHSFSAYMARAGNTWGELLSGDTQGAKQVLFQNYLDRQNHEALQAQQKEIERLGVTHEDLARIVASSAAEYNLFTQKIDQSSIGGQQLVHSLNEQRDAYFRVKTEFMQLAPGATEIADAFKVLGDASSSATDKAKALTKVLDEIFNVNEGKDDATAKLAEHIDQVAESAGKAVNEADGFGSAMVDASGKLDLTQKNARALKGELTGFRDELASVAANGGDVSASWDQMGPALDRLAEKYGLTKEQIRELGAQYGLLPGVVETLVKVSADEAKSDLGIVWSEMEKLQAKAGQPIELRVEDPNATKQTLEDIGYSVQVINEQTGQIRVTANTDAAKEALDNIINTTATLEETAAIVKVNMDIAPVGLAADEVRSIVEGIDRETASPKANLIIDDLLAGKDTSLSELRSLSAEVADPQAKLTIDELISKKQAGLEELKNLDAQRPNPKANLDTSGVKSGINEASSWFDRLKAKMSTPISIFASLVGGNAGFGSHANGGRIPRHAFGGRLPTSGPGTDRTDGILGIGSDGVPTSWVDAGEWVIRRGRSEQYDGLLGAINSGSPADIAAAARRALPAYADGGVVSARDLLAFAQGASVNGQRASRPLEGAPYVWGGVNWGDCSGAMSALANFATGRPAFASRFATGNQAQALSAMGFSSGMGGPNDFSIGWFNGGPWGGHTSGTIAGVNVEMGGGRGNGQIGGAASPASHPQFTHRAHIKLGGESASGPLIDGNGHGWDASGSGIVDSTSVNGIKVGGKSVSWGKAQDLYNDALRHVKTRVYDTGGILPPGGGAINLSGRPERILPPDMTRAFDEFIRVMPEAARNFARASDNLEKAMIGRESDPSVLAGLVGEEAAKGILNALNSKNFGGDFLGKTEIVQDAEAGLLAVRESLSDETEDVAKIEKDLAEAKHELAKAESEGGAVSTSNRRKIADAEEALAKARSAGKADKIADAQKRLNRAHEDAQTQLDKDSDKNAKTVKTRLDKVQKLEEKLSDARAKTGDQAERLEAAERALVAARFKAAQELAENIGEAFQGAAKTVSGLFNGLASAAETVQKLRQEEAKARINQINTRIARRRAQIEEAIATADVARARTSGAVSIARAEAELAKARKAQAKIASTSVEAMRGAVNRFYQTGKFGLEELASSAAEKTAEIRAAEWKVQEARAQAAVDALEATHKQQLAQLALQEATLTQASAVEMLRLKTLALAAHTKELYGLTPQGAKGAATGITGLGQVGSGLGKLVGGIAAGAAGFATGGPLGAVIGAGTALSGLKDLIQGGISLFHNKGEVGKAWKGMSIGQKLGLILGVGGGAAVAGAGGFASQVYGADAVSAGAKLADQLVDATVGSVTHNIDTKLDKLKRKDEERTEAAQFNADTQKAGIEAARAALESRHLAQLEALKSEVTYASLQKQIAESSSRAEAQALVEASKVEIQQRERMITLAQTQNRIAEDTARRITLMADVSRKQAEAVGVRAAQVEFKLPPGEAFTRKQTQAMLDAARDEMAKRIAELNKPTATDVLNAQLF